MFFWHRKCSFDPAQTNKQTHFNFFRNTLPSVEGIFNCHIKIFCFLQKKISFILLGDAQLCRSTKSPEESCSQHEIMIVVARLTTIWTELLLPYNWFDNIGGIVFQFIFLILCRILNHLMSWWKFSETSRGILFV